MNRVFPNQLRRANGLIYFSNAEAGVIVFAGVLTYLTVNFTSALAVAFLAAVLLFVHRKLDNHRLDHLEIFLRKQGLPKSLACNLCERDRTYERFEQRFPERERGRG